MVNEAHRATWMKYEEAWAGISSADRMEILADTSAEDCVFATPQAEGSSRAALAQVLEQFQQQFRGAHIRTQRFIEHHRQSHAEWIIYSSEGAELLSGASVARYGEDGRITHLAGFWET